MSYTKNGSELPLGTVVYMSRYNMENSLWRAVISNGAARFHDFIFDPKDGLWATYFARELWNAHPCRHPHCTLFDTLLHQVRLYTSSR